MIACWYVFLFCYGTCISIMDTKNQMEKCRVARDVLLCAVVSWVFVLLTNETIVGSVRFILHSTQTRQLLEATSGALR